jgi:hypothetical protein
LLLLPGMVSCDFRAFYESSFQPLAVKFSFFFNLKGQCHGIFNPQFFRQTIPTGLFVHRLMPFRIWIRIREDIRLQKSTPRYAEYGEVDF